MPNSIRRISQYIPTFLLAFIMACAVWVSAVTAADPNEQNTYPSPVPVSIIGLDPGLVLTSSSPQAATVRLLAPHSIWNTLDTNTGLVTATVDISGMKAGTHNVRIQVRVDPSLKPVDIVSVDPKTINVTIEALATRTLPVSLVISGDPAVGFELGVASLNQSYITVSGPDSLVKQIYRMVATVNASQANVDIHQTVSIQALDINNDPINGLTITPSAVSVAIPVLQLGGYRNVAVKVVTKGQVDKGYRETNISVLPPAVTVYSSDPKIVNALPGYIETQPIDLTGAHDDISIQVALNLPEGVTIVGSQTVNVQVGISAIVSSITLSNMPVQVINLGPDLAGKASPDRVDVILSGPLLLLDELNASQVHVTVDMMNKDPGDYQVNPVVTVDIPTILVESILPGTIQVTVINATPTPGPSPQGTPPITIQATITPTP